MATSEQYETASDDAPKRHYWEDSAEEFHVHLKDLKGQVVAAKVGDPIGVEMEIEFPSVWAYFEVREGKNNVRLEVVPATQGERAGVLYNLIRPAADDDRDRPNHRALLDEAAKIMDGDRQAAYGDAEASFARIAEYWSTFLSSKLDTRIELEPQDVALLLILLKVSRTGTSPTRADNWVDIISYAALGGEVTR